MIENTDDLPSLPDIWAWTRLEEIGIVASGGTPSTSVPEYFEGDVPWITPADLSSFTGKFIQRGRRNISEKGLHSSSAVLLPAGTILFSSRAPIGYVAIAANPIATNQGFKNLTLHEGVFNEYVFHYLKASKKLAESYGSGTTFREVSASRFRLIPIPLAPYNEQVRIAARLEELFGRLDAGVEGLRKVKAQLKRYRQAVLKYAFEGKLTEEWRKTHRDQIEPATKILEQISQENAVESNLPELPEGWIWTRLELVTANHDGKRVPVSRKKRESMKGVYPYYGASGIIDSVDNYLFDGNFLLIGEDGANLLARATPIAFQATGKFWVNNHAHVLTPLGGVPISYLEHYINRISLAEYVTGTAQPKLTQRAMNKIPVPLAPLKEQYKIAEEISRRFSVIDEISKEMELMIKYSDKLRHSILKKAFEGKLIPQDPNDEPAEKLLERIKTERFNRKSKFHNQLELSSYVK